MPRGRWPHGPERSQGIGEGPSPGRMSGVQQKLSAKRSAAAGRPNLSGLWDSQRSPPVGLSAACGRVSSVTHAPNAADANASSSTTKAGTS